MSVLRLAATSALFACAAAMLAGACGADAVGIDHCRDIEQARCEAAEPCGDIDDVAACRRFYRDHCMHGLAVEDSPSKIRVQACVSSLEAAGRCARDQISTASDCPELATETGIGSVCEAVREPQKLSTCSFLAPVPLTPPPPPQDGGDSADAPTEAASG
jgi:hypothetical protein